MIIDGSMSLRERQKAQRRQRIIEAGEELFFRDGFYATSMEAIAERAEVGVATLYNYFGTKGRLFADALHPKFTAVYERARGLLGKPPEDATEGVLTLIDIYQSFQNHWDCKLALKAALGPGLTPEPELDEITQQSEEIVKNHLETLLTHYQKGGQVRAEIDVADAAVVIFYVFNQHYIEYITHEDLDFNTTKARMDRQVRFIVDAIRTG